MAKGFLETPETERFPPPMTTRQHRPKSPRIKVARRWATLDAGAEHLGVSTKTLRNWIADGRLPGYRSGPRLIRVDLNELDALMQPLRGDAA